MTSRRGDIKVQLRFPLISTRHMYTRRVMPHKPSGHPFIFHEEHVRNSRLAQRASKILKRVIDWFGVYRNMLIERFGYQEPLSIERICVSQWILSCVTIDSWFHRGRSDLRIYSHRREKCSPEI